MTSHPSSVNKHAALYDFKLSLKNAAVPAVLTFFLSVYSFVFLPSYFIYSYYQPLNSSGLAALKKNLAMCMTDGENGVEISCCFLFFGILFALFSFGFTTNKKAVNVFFGSAVDRHVLFKNRISASLLTAALTIAAPIILDAFINISIFKHPLYIISYSALLFLQCFAYLLVGFSLTAIAISFCSTIIEGMLFSGSLILAPFAVVHLADSLCRVFLNGYNFRTVNDYYEGALFSNPSLLECTSFLNPLFFGKAFGSQYGIQDNIINAGRRYSSNASNAYAVIGYEDYEKISLNFILPTAIWILLGICFIFIAKRIFVNIKAENAGIHGIRPSASVFFTLECICLFFAIWIRSTILRGGYIDNVVFIIIGIVLSILLYFIIISVCKRTIRHKAKSIIAPAILAVSLAVSIGILAGGGFGYTSYVPDANNIKRAVITSDFSNIAADETMDSYYNDNAYAGVMNDCTYIYNPFAVFTSKHDLKALTNIHKKLISNTDPDSQLSFCVLYELKNGKTVSRHYTHISKNATYDIFSLRDSDAVREELTYLLTGDEQEQPILKKLDGSSIAYESVVADGEKNISKIFRSKTVGVIDTHASIKNKVYINNTPEFRKALLTDLLNSSFEERLRPKEPAIGAVCYDNYINDDTDMAAENTMNSEYAESVNFTAGYFIYPSMRNTIDYLKSTGEYDLFAPADDTILSVKIEKCSNIIREQFGYDKNQPAPPGLFMSRIQGNHNYNSDDVDILITDYFKQSKEIKDINEINKLIGKARCMYYAKPDDYVLLIKYKNAGYITKLIPAENM